MQQIINRILILTIAMVMVLTYIEAKTKIFIGLSVLIGDVQAVMLI